MCVRVCVCTCACAHVCMCVCVCGNQEHNCFSNGIFLDKTKREGGKIKGKERKKKLSCS